MTLVEDTLDRTFTNELPNRLIGDKAYDSDKLDAKLEETKQNARRTTAAALSTPLEGRAPVRLAAKLPPPCRTIRISS